MGKSTDDKPSGRVAFDPGGRAVWEWEVEPGVFVRDIDTQRLKSLQPPDGLTLEDDDAASSQPPVEEPARRTLDDLRKLSDEIKRARQWPPNPATGDDQ